MSRRKSTRKVSDADLLRLNSLGFSLGTIAKALGCHPTTVTLRLKEIGVAPSDTRRTFMEDVLLSLPEQQIEWIESQLGPHRTIKDYIKSLLTQSYIQAKDHHVA